MRSSEWKLDVVQSYPEVSGRSLCGQCLDSITINLLWRYLSSSSHAKKLQVSMNRIAIYMRQYDKLEM